MKIKPEQFREVAGEELKTRHTRAHLDLVGLVIQERRNATMDDFPDPSAALELGRAIRAESVARLPELLETFERNAAANGAVVHWAQDAEEANRLILDLARERGVRLVTKGKSMVTEEIGLNDVLTENGIEVFETDLGEFIIQLLGRPPYHIVGPALNVPVREICDIFLEKGIMKEPTQDPVELGQAARGFLRDKFHYVEMGITGVNIAVAETGTIINVENEGNIRLTKSSPRIQVSVMSLEKVVPTMRDAMHMLTFLNARASISLAADDLSMIYHLSGGYPALIRTLFETYETQPPPNPDWMTHFSNQIDVQNVLRRLLDYLHRHERYVLYRLAHKQKLHTQDAPALELLKKRGVLQDDDKPFSILLTHYLRNHSTPPF